MASILNKLYAKGYRDDMIDWYRVTGMLQMCGAEVSGTVAPEVASKPPVTIITCLKDFKMLYTWADQSNVRSITFRPVGSDDQTVTNLVVTNLVLSSNRTMAKEVGMR